MASTAAQVRTAWASVFANDTIKNITERAYDYDLITLVDAGLGAKYSARMFYDSNVNFFQYLVSRAQIYSAATAIIYRYNVDITYVREVDVAGANYKTALDVHETIFSIALSTLGKTWSDTVSGSEPQADPPDIFLDNLAEKDVWISRYRFTAFS